MKPLFKSLAPLDSCVFIYFMALCVGVMKAQATLSRLDNFHIPKLFFFIFIVPCIVSEYDQEIPQSQTADKPMAS